MKRFTLRAALGAVLLLFGCSSVVFAQVNYQLTGTLHVVSGPDPYHFGGSLITVTATMNQATPPATSITTSTYSSNTYDGVGVQISTSVFGTFTCTSTVTLTDNVGAPDTISLNSCNFLGITINGSVTFPEGNIITPLPAALPFGVQATSGALTIGSPAYAGTVFSILNGHLQATGAPPPSITPSQASWTPSAPQNSKGPASQNITFSGLAPVSFSTSVTTSDGRSWLSVSPAILNSDSSVTLAANPAGLAVGIYKGVVTLTYGPGYGPTVIPVAFTVTPSAPTIVSLSPSGGGGTSQTFTAVYSDPIGAGDFTDLLMLFNTTQKTSSACGVVYLPTSNKLHLYNDGGTGGVTGGVVPGSSGSLSNSQCTIQGSGSSVSIVGNTLLLKVALVFSNSFVGKKNVYLEAVSSLTATGYVKEGTWTPSSLGPPTVVSLSPSTGAGPSQLFSAVYSNPNGIADFNYVTLLFNTTLKAIGGCSVIYVPETNHLHLENDSATGLSIGITPGSAGSASNSQCTLEGAGSSVIVSGNELTVNVLLSFSDTFTGNTNSYMDSVGKTAVTDWLLMGTWTP